MLALSRSASWINRLYTDYTGPMDEHMTQMNKDSWHSSRMKRKQKQKYIKCLFESTLTTVAKQACKFGCTSWGTQSHLIKNCVFSRVIFLDLHSNNLWQYLHFKVIISKWMMTPQGALFYWVKLFLYHQKSPTQELIHYNFSVEWAIQSFMLALCILLLFTDGTYEAHLAVITSSKWKLSEGDFLKDGAQIAAFWDDRQIFSIFHKYYQS